MISTRAAIALYALLVAAAVWTLHGTALALALVIVLGLAAKTAVECVRRRMDG